ncbi:hypothetical protein A3K73_06565 [Candidatus Pacearchaeota archaeon RBG_13_36_9]|nr:MAG: hypothetical protein A3K73_06565 [Candidatus Pacearchaeota archaeon RBG_13_36_9]
MENILKICLAISIIGIFLLLFLANTLPPKAVNLGEINDKMLNQKVKVHGTIFRIEDKETFKILSIKDETGKIDIICECGNLTYQDIEVEGTIKEYREYLQIQADKITAI